MTDANLMQDGHTPDAMQRHNFHVMEAVPFLARKSRAPAPISEPAAWHGEFLELFLRNQLNLAPIMPILTLLLGLTSLAWVPTATAMAWLVGTLGCHTVQLFRF